MIRIQSAIQETIQLGIKIHELNKMKYEVEYYESDGKHCLVLFKALNKSKQPSNIIR